MVFQPNRKFLSVLYGSAFGAFCLPLLIFTGARLTHRNNNGEQQDYNQDQNQYNYNNQQQASSSCRWWQWGCSDNYQYNQEEGSRDEQENALPWWWPWAEDERRRDPEDQANPTLVIIYLWTLLMMGGILFYAYKTVKDMRDMVGLAASLLLLANCSFISTLYIGSLEGAVEDDGRIIEEQGFYGQFGVLLYLTNFLFGVFGVIWFFIIRSMVNDQHTTKLTVSPSDYLRATSDNDGGSNNKNLPSPAAKYEAPSVKVNHHAAAQDLA